MVAFRMMPMRSRRPAQGRENLIEVDKFLPQLFQVASDVSLGGRQRRQGHLDRRQIRPKTIFGRVADSMAICNGFPAAWLGDVDTSQCPTVRTPCAQHRSTDPRKAEP